MSARDERPWSLWTPDQHLREAQRLIDEERASEEEPGAGTTRLTIAAMHVEMAKINQMDRAANMLRLAILQAGSKGGGR